MCPPAWDPDSVAALPYFLDTVLPAALYLLADGDRLVAVARHEQPISKVIRVVDRKR